MMSTLKRWGEGKNEMLSDLVGRGVRGGRGLVTVLDVQSFIFY